MFYFHVAEPEFCNESQEPIFRASIIESIKIYENFDEILIASDLTKTSLALAFGTCYLGMKRKMKVTCRHVSNTKCVEFSGLGTRF